MRKRFLIPWFGPLPEWMPQYVSNTGPLAAQGWEFVVITSEEEYRKRFQDRTGITVPSGSLFSDTRKLVDYRPALGFVFDDYIQGCEFWGHTDLDCVYGRLSHFVPDEQLAELDVWSNDADRICGPFTLYRNTDPVNQAFQRDSGWKAIFESPILHAWEEHGFSEVIKKTSLRVSYNHMQGADATDLSDIDLRADGGLWQHGREIMMFHFNCAKRWPVKR